MIARLLPLLLLLPASALAGPGIYATGWNAETGSHYDQGTGLGITIDGGSRTEYRFRALRTARDEIVLWNPLWQSFWFSVRDDRPRSVVSFETSVRGGVDTDTGDFRGEVLYAFVDLAPARPWARLRVGRQLLATNGRGGWTRFDGISGQITLHHLGIEAYAGTSLRSRMVVLPEGEELDTGWGKDWTYGFSLAAVNLRDTQLRLGFQDRHRDGQLARRHLSVDLHKGLFGRVNIRGNLSVDLLHQRLQEAFVGLDGRPLTWLKVGFEYERWQPSFDADEIWSVFRTDPYDALRGHAYASPFDWLTVWLGGGAQLYPDAVSRDLVPFEDIENVSGSQNAGVRLRPVDFLEFTVDERVLDGAGGQKIAVAITGRVRPWRGRLDVALRGDIQRYDFELQPGLEGDYGGLSLDVGGSPVPWVRVSARGEYIFTPFLKNNFQVSATLDFLLGVRIHDRGQASASLRDRQGAMLAGAGRALPGMGRNLAGLDGGIGVTGALR